VVRVIDAWGIQHRYEDASGVQREVPAATIAALRELIGRPAEDESRPLIVRAGMRAVGGPGLLRLEDGSEVSIGDVLPPDLPVGYHTLLRRGGGECGVIVHPGRCHFEPGPRRWGFAVQLYAARSRASWGIGDLGDLRRLARWSREELAAGFLLVNPLAATTSIGSDRASPYFPATRRFRNPIYLRIEDVPGADRLASGLEPLAVAGRALDGERTIDRDAVWRLKRAALERLWTHAREDAEFATWYDGQGEDVRIFATWCALVEDFGPRWRSWPEDYRHPRTVAVARFCAQHADRVRFHAWLQWLLECQLAAAGAELPILHDLPIGIDPDGMDAWEWQDLIALDARIGAPPDAFNQRGQDWGLPPFVPWRLRAAGYRPFIETIRAGLRLGGGLRVDHVMGLFRLWWIPPGGTPRDGAYVRYPADELLAVLAIESQRARATVVGEDLGTVEEEARRTLAQWDVLSYRLLWFEASDPASWPRHSLAAVTTHDLPTVAGLWDGSDLATQRHLGFAPDDESMHAIRDRLRTAGGLPNDARPEDAILAAHRLLARAPAHLVSVTLEDAAAETERPNVPGADGRRPNWSLALRTPLEALETAPLPRALAAIFRESEGAET
jgi:4-alpha-glucanotransferase